MPKSNRVSVDEFMAKRQDSINSKGAIVKAAKMPTSVNEAARTAKFVMSAQVVDRMGDVVHTSGIDIEEFEKNPVGLLFHSRRSWPIGSWQDLARIGGANKRLEGVLKFVDEAVLEEADKAFSLIKAGVIRACSIGFIPKEIEWLLDEDGKNTWGFDIKESELLECSVVPIPANPAALVKGADGDLVLAKDLLEDVLDNWAMSPTGVMVSREEYEKTYASIERQYAGPILGMAESGMEMIDTTKDGDEWKSFELREIKKDPGEVNLKVNVEGLDEVEKRLSAFDKMLDGIATKIKSVIGTGETHFPDGTPDEIEEKSPPALVKGSRERAAEKIAAIQSQVGNLAD